MNHRKAIHLTILPCILFALISCTRLNPPDTAKQPEPADSADLKAIFADPPRQYATAPLWTWNDMLTEDQIRSTMRDLASQKVMQVFVHPRPGLMTPYLSKDWFRLWKVALDEAEKLDMNVWIYDENSYPSGFAGGLVPEAMPESRGKGIHFAETNQPPKLTKDTLAIYSLADNTFENVTKKLKSGQTLPDAKYLVASIRLAPAGGWFGGKYYVDLLKPGVTEKFIEITMEAYRRELGEHFGKRLPGWFTDEPHLAPAGGLHFSDTLLQDFQKRWGYDLIDHLPSLRSPIGDFKRIRHNYYQLLLELFIDRWAKPCYEYCEKYNLEFTGHYWEHGWPGAGHGGDNMAMYAWHQRPAIDTLMNQYNEGTNAQFGNVRAVLELASVANQLGKKRTLCEAYGAGGWDLRFEDMKRIGDWLYVLGVNTLDEHISYVTIRGARKRDHPQSFSYHEPWWPDYHIMATYFTRLSAALSSGEQINKILLIEPTTTTWMYQTDGSHLNNIGNQFQKLLTDMAKAQVEFDIGCEDIIERNGSVQGKSLIIGQRAYETVIIPPLTETLNAKTMDLIEAYAKAGGKILCCGQPPTLIEGQPSDRGKAAAKNTAWQETDKADIIKTLITESDDPFAIKINRGQTGILFHHRRKLKDGRLLFLTNTSIDAPITGTIQAAAKSIQQWNLETGKSSPYQFATNNAGLKTEFDLPPCGSILLFLSDKSGNSAAKDEAKTTIIPATDKPEIKRIAPNVLTLDYVDITAAAETKKDTYFYQANQFAFQKNGMDRNPWDSAVQLHDQLITKTFPPESGFEATYKFNIEAKVPNPLHIVIERTDLYDIECNGKKVSAKKGDWWLDKAFSKIDITAAAKTGENIVRIKASPMTIYHELEPAYLLGDFALKPTDSGFVVTSPAPLKLGPWNNQGHPFYAEGVSYTQQFNIPNPTAKYSIKLPEWYGSVARVTVNGKLAGRIHRQPWQCEVTDSIRKGKNTVEVVVVGTLKNTLGPHHNNPPLGSAWPGMFHNAPNPGPPSADKYSNVPYGLFKPFELVNRDHGKPR